MGLEASLVGWGPHQRGALCEDSSLSSTPQKTVLWGSSPQSQTSACRAVGAEFLAVMSHAGHTCMSSEQCKHTKTGSTYCGVLQIMMCAVNSSTRELGFKIVIIIIQYILTHHLGKKLWEEIIFGASTGTLPKIASTSLGNQPAMP